MAVLSKYRFRCSGCRETVDRLAGENKAVIMYQLVSSSTACLKYPKSRKIGRL